MISSIFAIVLLSAYSVVGITSTDDNVLTSSMFSGVSCALEGLSDPTWCDLMAFLSSLINPAGRDDGDGWAVGMNAGAICRVGVARAGVENPDVGGRGTRPRIRGSESCCWMRAWTDVPSFPGLGRGRAGIAGTVSVPNLRSLSDNGGHDAGAAKINVLV